MDDCRKLWGADVPGPLVHLINKRSPRARLAGRPSWSWASPPCSAQGGRSDQAPVGQVVLGSSLHSASRSHGTREVMFWFLFSLR